MNMVSERGMMALVDENEIDITNKGQNYKYKYQ